MALRKWHLFWGFIFFAIFMAAYYFFFGNDPNAKSFELIWVTTAFLMAMVGAELADYDQLTSVFSHRDIFTHSALIPLLMTLTFPVGIIIGGKDQVSESLIFALPFATFNLGYASHLLLDLFPTFDVDGMMRKKGLIRTTLTLTGGAVEGITSAEVVKQLTGTYLIHLPFRMPVVSEKEFNAWETRKTLPKHQTRYWLFFNGLFCILLCAIVLNFYLEFFPLLAL